MNPAFKFFVKLGAITVAICVVYVGWISITVFYKANQNNAEMDSDAIVVLGAAQFNGRPSAVLRARLDHAVNLWSQGYAPVIVVTGGKIPGDTSTEAGASATYLASKGVPDSAILREVQGRTSWESLQASARFLYERNISKVILVSDPFHNARISAMASAVGLEPTVSPTQTSPIEGREQVPYFVKEIAALSLGKALGFSRVAGLEKSFASSE